MPIEKYIYNCEATNCGKYGFFFEHQGKFKNESNWYIYPAQKSQGFVVANCIASGNMYDFGGERAYDVTYENCSSKTSDSKKHVTAIHFQEQSIRCHIVNCTVEKQFNDVDSSCYYFKPANWALKQGVIESDDKNWNFNHSKEVTRGEAINYFYRLEELPGNKVVYGSSLDNQIETGFDDVPGFSPYALAVKWAKDKGIVKGTSSSNFSPEDICTREQVIVMLYRYAGSPDVTEENPFTDVTGAETIKAVTWASKKGITTGTNSNNREFEPNGKCTRAMIITWLYRFYCNNVSKEYNISYNLLEGKLDEDNKETYKAGTDTFTLNNPTKDGYIFNGWTGSNIKYDGYTQTNYIPSKTVSITKNDYGNKTYSANWTPITYKVKFNANGGTGTMEDEEFTYNEPKALLTNKFTKTCCSFVKWNTKAN